MENKIEGIKIYPEIYQEMQEERLEDLVSIANLMLEWDKAGRLHDMLCIVREQIYNYRFNKRPLWFITSNIVIRELPFSDLSEEYCCFEYHKDDKSLFFDKFKIKNSNNKL